LGFTPFAVLSVIAVYFAILLVAGRLTSRGASGKDFYNGGKNSPWYIVAISMIGTSISGVTFVSVPGMVQASQFSYIQMVLGFILGYAAVAYILIPLYYRMNISSIYAYLGERFSDSGRVTGSLFFILSKYLGCGVRMYLTTSILQILVFDSLGIPFIVNVAVTMLVVWAYTLKGGVRTIVWVDLMQTFALIAAVVLSIVFLSRQMGLDAGALWSQVRCSPMSRVWFFDDFNDKRYFFKQFFAGMFTVIAMTGLDQDMMQKNLSCRSLRDSQKNVLSYGVMFLPVNLLFLSLGVLLYQFCAASGISIEGADNVYPIVATQYLSPVVGVVFILGLIAAAFSSAGSALTALTSSVSLDILKMDSGERASGKSHIVIHCANAVLMSLIIMGFRKIGNGSVINAVYMVASYTYGPLLGLFVFGMVSRRKVRGRSLPAVCILSPILSFVLSSHSEAWLGGYQMGFELLLVNGALTFIGLLFCSKKCK